MSRVLPPLNPLRTFEVAARHVSFTRAAAELGVTQAAVSRQVALLEAWTKVPLFERLASEVVLTEAGRRYFARIHGAFADIDGATQDLRRPHGPRPLQLRACAMFANLWLRPRLVDFHARHPDIEINLGTSVGGSGLSGAGLDASIRFGAGVWEDHQAHKIFDEVLAPVYNPSLLRSGRPLSNVEDVANHPVLTSRYRPKDWAIWAAHAGVRLQRWQMHGFESSALAYQAAQQGKGIAMGQLRLLESELAAGDLVLPFDCILVRPFGYFLLRPRNRTNDSRLNRFCDWLLKESAATRIYDGAIGANIL